MKNKEDTVNKQEKTNNKKEKTNKQRHYFPEINAENEIPLAAANFLSTW